MVRSINDVNVDDDYIRKIRGSYYLVGALLGKISQSGGGTARG